jgi:rSAM/selenodomain-associated transferase 2
VSVLVPALDEAAALPGLLARLLEAEDAADRADEVVVADGGSADGSVELARAAGARVVSSAPGRGRQLAAGARALGGEVLVVLHADCLPEPGALSAVRRAFADPGTVTAAMRQRIDARGAVYRVIERAADARCRWLGVVYGDSGLCVRRAAYDAVGGFRALPLFEDVDLSRRLARLGRVRLVEGARLTVSARRWQREGPLRCTLRNWILTLAYAAGVPPERLARHYRRHGAR